MNEGRVLAALARAACDLRAEGRRWALVGGLAVSARAEPRLTRDIDFAVGVADDRDAESLIRNLLGRDYAVLATAEGLGTGRLATVRLAFRSPERRGVVVDLLLASSGIEAEVVAEATSIEVVEGLVLPVAAIPHLLAMKVLAHDPDMRPRDGEDIRNLLAVATDDEITRARGLLRLVEVRGYSRGKDLLAELERFLNPRG